MTTDAAIASTKVKILDVPDIFLDDKKDKFLSDTCKIDDRNACSDIQIGSKIYLFSASFLRYFKWGETINDRLKMHDSVIESILDEDDKSGAGGQFLLKKMTDHHQYFIKFGSWTRDSPIIFRLLNKLSCTHNRMGR